MYVQSAIINLPPTWLALWDVLCTSDGTHTHALDRAVKRRFSYIDSTLTPRHTIAGAARIWKRLERWQVFISFHFWLLDSHVRTRDKRNGHDWIKGANRSIGRLATMCGRMWRANQSNAQRPGEGAAKWKITITKQRINTQFFLWFLTRAVRVSHSHRLYLLDNIRIQ